ncbi:MAG TPA: hypothetical protein VF017_14290 [Thermoanaerobaculia bacterium]|nr:hypothetical protein [Thermoanaerobaculia bacterium]
MTRSSRAAGLSLTLALLALPLIAQPGLVGPTLRANVNEAHSSKRPATAYLTNGSFVVVWENDQLGVFARRFAADGSALGGDVTVAGNARLPSIPGAGPVTYNAEPAVAALAGGGFLAVWAEERSFLRAVPFHEEREVLSRSIVGQRYDAAGNAVGNRINVSTSSQAFHAFPAIATHPSRGLAVAWQSDDRQDGVSLRDGVFLRRLTAAGAPTGAPERVNEANGATASRPALAFNRSGRLLVAWDGEDGSGAGVVARLYRPGGAAATGETLINQTTASVQRRPAVAAAGNAFQVAWQGRAGDTVYDAKIFGRQVSAAGVPRGSERALSSGEQGGNGQVAPALAVRGGGYLVTWVDYDVNFPIGVFARELDANGVPSSAEVEVSQGPVGAQVKTAVAGDGAGTFVVAFEGFVGDELGAMAQRLVTGAPAAEAGVLVAD